MLEAGYFDFSRGYKTPKETFFEDVKNGDILSLHAPYSTMFVAATREENNLKFHQLYYFGLPCSLQPTPLENENRIYKVGCKLKLSEEEISKLKEFSCIRPIRYGDGIVLSLSFNVLDEVDINNIEKALKKY